MSNNQHQNLSNNQESLQNFDLNSLNEAQLELLKFLIQKKKENIHIIYVHDFYKSLGKSRSYVGDCAKVLVDLGFIRSYKTGQLRTLDLLDLPVNITFPQRKKSKQTINREAFIKKEKENKRSLEIIEQLRQELESVKISMQNLRQQLDEENKDINERLTEVLGILSYFFSIDIDINDDIELFKNKEEALVFFEKFSEEYEDLRINIKNKY